MESLRKPASICAFIIIFSFLFLPWLRLGGASLSGYELSTTSGMSKLWLFPSLALLAIVAGFFKATRIVIPVLVGASPFIALAAGYAASGMSRAQVTVGQSVVLFMGVLMIFFSVLRAIDSGDEEL